MALNKKIQFKEKEVKYKSIAEYNVLNNKAYYLFNPKNITKFKCTIAQKEDTILYLHEHLECMWGNDEIDEYILLGDYVLDQFNNFKKEKAINKIDINGHEVLYTFKRTIIGRWLYNVTFTIENVRYYLIIKTIKQPRFFSLLKEFFNEQLSFN